MKCYSIRVLKTLVRMAHGISGRKDHRAKDLFHERSHGRPPIELEALLPNDDSPTRLEVTEIGIAQPRRELVFESDQDKQVVPIPHSVATVDALNEHLGRYESWLAPGHATESIVP